MNTKIPTLVILFTLIVTASLNDAALSSGAAPTDSIYFDLVVDEPRQLLYGSERDGGSIHVISMITLEVTTTVSVGAQPAGIDLSPDGNKLAVALYGQGEIAILDLNTLEVINRIVPQGTSGPNRPFDVLFGRPGRLYSVGNPDSEGLDYVHVFNTDTWLEIGISTYPAVMRAAPRLAMTADQNTLYVSQVSFTPQKIYRFDITSDIPTQTAEAPHGGVAVNTLCVMPDNMVYSSRGQIWSADLSTLAGTFPASGDEIECSESNQRVYITSGAWVIAIDTVSLTRLFILPLAGSGGVARLDGVEETIYVSTSMGVKKMRAYMAPPIYLPFVTRDYCAGFSDDFSNPASGWAVVNNDYWQSQYLNGEFLVHSKKSGYLYLFQAPACQFDNYTVEVDARWMEKPGHSYGLLFDIQENFSYYYLFDVNTEYQQFRFYRYSPSGFSEILAPTYSPDIRTGIASNHLGATRIGNLITLYVNGIELGTWWDNNITGVGGAGIISSPYTSTPKSDALFDNFRLAGLPSTSGGAGSPVRTSAGAPDSSALENFVEPAPVDPGW